MCWMPLVHVHTKSIYAFVIVYHNLNLALSTVGVTEPRTLE